MRPTRCEVTMSYASDARLDALLEISGGVNPFRRSGTSWHGRLRSVDGTAVDDFDWEDVAEMLAHYATSDPDGGKVWDGDALGLIRLKDGRFVTWETTWGPTGDGFHEDAYGGEADVIFASTFEAALRFGLTEDGRRLLMGPELADAIARFMTRADATLALQGLFPARWIGGSDFPTWRDG